MNTTWMRAASCPDRLDLPWLADTHDVTAWERQTMAAICDQCPVLLACKAFVAEQDITGGFWAGRDRDPNAAIPRRAPGWVNQPLPGLDATPGHHGFAGLGGLGGAA